MQHTGSTRVAVGESSRPNVKSAGLEQELTFRRQSSNVRSQPGNMNNITITMNGKPFQLNMITQTVVLVV